jgi:hypothetical protein
MRLGGKWVPSRRLAGGLLVLAGILATGRLSRELVPADWVRVVHLILAVAAAIYVAAVAERLRNAAVVVTSVLLCLAAIEAYAVIEYPRPINIHTPDLFAPQRAVLGWGSRHPGIFHHTGVDAKTGRRLVDVDYTIDEHLNRKVDSAPDGPAVAFFGDSFTFGWGLPDADTLPQNFADLTGRVIRVTNLGFPGYGPQQFLRALETGLHDGLLQPSRLFVFQTAAWHAERSSCIVWFVKHAPRYRLNGGRLELAGSCRWWSALNRFLFAASATYRAFIAPLVERVRPSDIELYLAIIERAAELAREKYGVPTAILYIPDPDYAERAGISDAEIMRRLRDDGLIVIDGALDPSAFPGQPLLIPGDGHPTAVANRARALLVRDTLQSLLARKP